MNGERHDRASDVKSLRCESFYIWAICRSHHCPQIQLIWRLSGCVLCDRVPARSRLSHHFRVISFPRLRKDSSVDRPLSAPWPFAMLIHGQSSIGVAIRMVLRIAVANLSVCDLPHLLLGPPRYTAARRFKSFRTRESISVRSSRGRTREVDDQG